MDNVLIPKMPHYMIFIMNVFFVGRIASYEARLLLRSWGFRIFSGFTLINLTVITIAFVTHGIARPHYMSSLTEFFKRDRSIFLSQQ
jgi:hypothetical protein